MSETRWIERTGVSRTHGPKKTESTKQRRSVWPPTSEEENGKKCRESRGTRFYVTSAQDCQMAHTCCNDLVRCGRATATRVRLNAGPFPKFRSWSPRLPEIDHKRYNLRNRGHELQAWNYNLDCPNSAMNPRQTQIQTAHQTLVEPPFRGHMQPLGNRNPSGT